MHDVLRQRLLRRIESLPEEQVYQVLDYIEFLESKYARNLPGEMTGLQRFAEGLEDRLRKKALSPNTLREAFQLIAAADRVLSSVSSAGRQIINELGSTTEPATGGQATVGQEAEPRTEAQPRESPTHPSGQTPTTPSSPRPNQAGRRDENGGGEVPSTG